MLFFVETLSDLLDTAAVNSSLAAFLASLAFEIAKFALLIFSSASAIVEFENAINVLSL